MNLSQAFSSIAYKQLVEVDLPDRSSHQHEINGDASLRALLGTEETTRESIKWHYFSDDAEPSRDFGNITFYDTRSRNPGRTAEWRLYYSGDFLSHAEPGDMLVLARSRFDGQLFGLLLQRESSWYRGITLLLESDSEQYLPGFQVLLDPDLQQIDLGFIEQKILDELELEGVNYIPDNNDQQLMLDTFGNSLPDTRTVSEFARGQSHIQDNFPDEILVRWLNREYQLFSAWEYVIIQNKLDEGFNSVDEFFAYSLSALNTRKSRMGHSLENHLEALFRRYQIRYTRQARTERGNKADFIFPREEEYQNTDFPSERLSLLAVKSTLKERWRQPLDEADRVSHKHLCTLDKAISTNQVEAMRQNLLTLVIPRPIQDIYSEEQRQDFLCVEDFIVLVEDRQGNNSF